MTSDDGAIEHLIAGGLYLRRRAQAAKRGTLLYVHGLGESGLAFEGLLAEPRLAAWRQLAPDLPGYGKSPWPGTPLNFEQIVDRLEAWLGAEPPVVVVGHSMGGAIGQLLCERHPRRIAAFVNVEGNVSLDDCTFSGRAAPWTAADFAARGFAELCDGVYQQGANHPALRTYYASMRMSSPRQLHHNAVELVAMSRQESLASRFGGLAVPRLFLYGSPGGSGQRSLTLLRQAGVEPIALAPAGHWAFLDQPTAFVERLAAFLDEL